MNSCVEHLSKATASDFGSKSVIVVDASDSVSHVFETLLSKKILSAPIYDKEEKEFLGFVDMVDIVEFIVLLFEKSGGNFVDMWDVVSGMEMFKKTPVKDISDISQRNPFLSYPKDISLLEVTKAFVDGAFGSTIHRACLWKTENEEIEAIVSQSDVISFLDKNANAECPLLKKSIKSSKIAASNVITIQENKKSIEAFRLMHTHKISGLGIVDSHGTLIGNISARDLKGIVGSGHNYLFSQLYTLSVFELVKKVRQAEINESSKTRIPAIAIQESLSILDVIRKLAATRIHRLYVKNQNQELVGVVSLRDILRYLTANSA